MKHKKQEFTVTEWKMLLEAMRQLRLPSINQTVLKAKVAEHVGALQEEE